MFHGFSAEKRLFCDEWGFLPGEITPFRNTWLAADSAPDFAFPAVCGHNAAMAPQTSRARYLPALAAFNAILALAFGTFAAHGIKDPQAREWIMTGVMFQLPHVAAVFGILGWRNSAIVRSPAWAISIGSLIFAGDLYALALGAPRYVAAFAPIGGSMMMIGWLWLAIVALAGERLDP